MTEDLWIKAFNRLEAAITHHRKAKLTGFDTSDEIDEALWKVRDKILSDLAGGVAENVERSRRVLEETRRERTELEAQLLRSGSALRREGERRESCTAHIWKQPDGYHWALSGFDITPVAGIEDDRDSAVRRLAYEMLKPKWGLGGARPAERSAHESAHEDA